MKFLICVFCMCRFLNSVRADCDPNAPKPTLQRLRESLLCGYDKTERPYFTKGNQTQVYMMVIPRYIDFEDSQDHIELSTLIYMAWYDPSLKWTKTDYDGIVYTPFKADSIWLPDFRISNSKLIDGNLNTQGQSVMLVKYDGYVHYATPTLLGVHCVADYMNWPFDRHVCNFTITSEMHMGTELDLYEGNIDIRMHKYIPSHEWELLKYESLRDVEYSHENTSAVDYEVFMTLRFTIQRHSAVLAASFISPAVALMVFSLGLLFIEATNSDRLTVISLMLTVQCLYLQYLAYKISSNGDKTPKIVKFFASNLFLTGVLLIETLIVGLMPTWNSKPAWVQTVTNVIGSNRVLKIILLPENETKKFINSADSGNEEGAELVSNDDTRQQWKMFAEVVNRLTFLLLLMFYVIFIILCFVL